MPDGKTVYYGDDGRYTGLFMYVADRPAISVPARSTPGAGTSSPTRTAAPRSSPGSSSVTPPTTRSRR